MEGFTERLNKVRETICPNCGAAFTIDEAGYADILKQVRDTDFEKQLHDRLELAEQEKRRAIELAETKAAGELQKAADAKDSEIQALRARLDAGGAPTRSLSNSPRRSSPPSLPMSPRNSKRKWRRRCQRFSC